MYRIFSGGFLLKGIGVFRLFLGQIFFIMSEEMSFGPYLLDPSLVIASNCKIYMLQMDSRSRWSSWNIIWWWKNAVNV